MQITFKDDDVKNLKGFLELVRDKASFNLSMEDSVLLTKYVQFMQQHIKAVHAHVMEVISLREPEPSSEPAPKPSKAKKAE